MHPVNSRHNSAELTQLIRKHSIGVARRLSTASQILWQQGDQVYDPLLDPLGAPQSINVGPSPHGEGVEDKLRSILDADEDGPSHESRPLFCELLVYRAMGAGVNGSHPVDGTATSSADVELDLEKIAFWQEASRWIKFEETVEEGGSRWSKPHVTLLNVQRLLQIRTCLQKQATLFDLNATSFGHVVELLSSTWTKRHHLTEEESRAVKAALMSPKRHLVKTRLRSERSTPYEDIAIPEAPESRGTSPYSTVTSLNALTANNNSSKAVSNVNSASGAKMTINQSLFRKLPETAEAACVFVGYVNELRFPISEFVRLLRASVFNDVTELPIPTRFIFTLLLPTEHAEREAVQLGRCMGTLFVDDVFSRVCYKARHGYELAYAVDELLGQSVVIPPGKWNPSARLEPPENAVPTARPATVRSPERLGTAIAYDDHEGPTMMRSGRLFGGLIGDLKCKFPWYLSDFTDVTKGRISQTVAAAIFLFFANISKIITFGGVMGHALDDHIGAIENVMAGGICGVIYALFSGQPLCVLSATGPCLVFEVILYKLSYAMAWDFLVVRAWVGIWTAVVLLILVAVDASVMVSFITRFTEEAFATMISIIFLIKAVEELLEISHKFPMVTDLAPLMNETCQCLASENYTTHTDRSSLTSSVKHHSGKSKLSSLYELNGTANETIPEQCHPYVPDVFMFSIILFFFTFVIAFGLKLLRNSPFFPSKVREIIADFNVTIAIVVMSVVNLLVGLQVPCLEVPDEFEPTRPDRGWFVNPFALKQWWLGLATALPAVFFSILVMMDQNITSVIINRKDNKLQKGYGYHLDLTVIAFLMIICSLLGIPFYVAATVISLMHVHSLRLTSETVAPGEKPQFLGLREQRVTALLAHILIGLAVFLTPVMKHIPMPVLLGVFLYMGIVSLAGQQFVMRLLILLMPAKHQPDYPWLRLVRLKRVNLFTIIQLISLVFLMVVEEIKTISMVFPLMLVIMIFIRKWLLQRIFTQKELFALDDPLPTWSEVLKPRRQHATTYTDGKADQLILRQDPKVVVTVSPSSL